MLDGIVARCCLSFTKRCRLSSHHHAHDERLRDKSTPPVTALRAPGPAFGVPARGVVGAVGVVGPPPRGFPGEAVHRPVSMTGIAGPGFPVHSPGWGLPRWQVKQFARGLASA